MLEAPCDRAHSEGEQDPSGIAKILESLLKEELENFVKKEVYP